MAKTNKKSFLNSYLGFDYMHDVSDIVSEYFKEIKLSCFGHNSVWPDGNHTFLFTNHDWPRERVLNQIPPPGFTIYDKITDKVIFPAIDKVNSLDWSEDIVNLAKKRFNVHNPMIITRKFNDHYEVFSFNLNSKSAYETYVNNLDFFERFIDYYHDKARRMIERVKKNCLVVNSQYLPSTKTSHLVSDAHSTKAKKYYFVYDKKYILLSSKEYQCLSFLSHGMRIKGIAQEMDLSVRTVETYIKRVKNKLNLSNTNDLCKAYWENKIMSG